MNKWINKIDNYYVSLNNKNIHNNMDYFVDTIKELYNVDTSNNEFIIKRISYVISCIIKYLNEENNLDIKFNLFSNSEDSRYAFYDYNNKIINVNIEELCKETFVDLFITILHEYKHVLQHEVYAGGVEKALMSDPNYLLMAKENAYLNSLNDNNIYVDNYGHLLAENDAERYAIYRIYKYAYNYDDSITNSINDYFNSDVNNGLIDSSYAKEMNVYFPLNYFIEINNERKDFVILIDKYIKNNPDIVNKYKLLSILFKDNSYITYDDIKSINNKLLDSYDKDLTICVKKSPYYQNSYVSIQEQIQSLVHNIIRSDPIMYLEYLLSNNSNDKIIKKYLDNHPSIFSEYYDDIERLENNNKYYHRIRSIDR